MERKSFQRNIINSLFPCYNFICTYFHSQNIPSTVISGNTNLFDLSPYCDVGKKLLTNISFQTNVSKVLRYFQFESFKSNQIIYFE